MTREERTSLDRKIDPEIAKLLFEASLIQKQTDGYRLEHLVIPMMSGAVVVLIGATATIINLFGSRPTPLSRAPRTRASPPRRAARA